jgi:hypothetical protein
MKKFDIFTFQLSLFKIIEQSLFEKCLTKEELIERKNEFFNEIFNDELNFYHRRNKLKYHWCLLKNVNKI